jgi:cysteine-S-conjugate beta-lyase
MKAEGPIRYKNIIFGRGTMYYNFDELIDRRHTESQKWNTYAPDILPMWVADMDFPSPEPVIRALHERVEHGIFGYAYDPPGLRQAVVQWLEERHAWQVQPEDLVFNPGVITGFNLVCHTFAEAGNGVLMQTPIYPPILEAPEKFGLLRQDAGLVRISDGSYVVDWDDFEAAITADTRIFILCNPHNPVGRVYTREELAHMAEICLRKGVLICSDEIHCDLVFSGHSHIPIASLDPEVARHTITLMAPSKTFNIAGLKCSVAIIQNPDLRKQFLDGRQGLVPRVNMLGMAAALAAYQEGGDWLDELLVYLQANRDYLYDYVNAQLPQISMVKPEGTYLAWLDCHRAGIEGNLCEFFIREGRVALNDGPTFGPGGEGFVRLNFGCPRQMLTQALEQMQTAISTL